jgi:hypothetical protein
MGCGGHSLVGRVYRSKRWAKRWAKGRSVRKVVGGWKIGGKKRTHSTRRKRRKARR